MNSARIKKAGRDFTRLSNGLCQYAAHVIRTVFLEETSRTRIGTILCSKALTSNNAISKVLPDKLASTSIVR